MDIQQLRYFLEICKYGSISRAANNLIISPQGLSVSIRRLEKSLGCDLFYRKGNALVLTTHGQYLLDNARDIVDSYDRLMNYFRSESNENQNNISIMCVYSVLSKAPSALKELLLSKEASGISMGECYSAECPEYLENGSASFAITYKFNSISNFNYDTLFDVEHCFIVHRSHPLAQYSEISLSQLNGEKLIIPSKRVAVRHTLDEIFREHQVTPTIFLESDRILQIYNFIMQDHSIVARATVADAQEINNPEMKILKIKDIEITTPVVLAYRKDRLLAKELMLKEQILTATRRETN